MSKKILITEKHLFDFFTKEENSLGENIHFGREKMTIPEAIEYAKEYDLIFEEVLKI